VGVFVVGFFGECGTISNKALRRSLAMVKTLVRSKHSMKQSHPVVSPIKRDFSPEEFDADTEEERPIAVLAERRKQFLAALEAKQSEAD